MEPLSIIVEVDHIREANLNFLNSLLLVYRLNIPFTSLPFTNFDNFPEHWKFFYNPALYDFDKFDPLWLTMTDMKSVFETLNKIPELRIKIREYLQQENSSRFVADIYLKYFL